MLSTEALVELAGELRRQGFAPGAHELTAAAQVLAGLAGLAGRAEPPLPRELAPYLAPIFCRTPEQQHVFPALFAEWIAAWDRDPPAAAARVPLSTSSLYS
ncbi:MAG: hypothetical protein P9E67_11135, partial [Candidatus Competibacter sp.]|nr:hypothetical protein [Candidatus Competibacter sp.]